MIQARHAIDLRTRLIERNHERRKAKMWERIQEAERDRWAALLRRAHALHMSAEPDEIKPGSWVTRINADRRHGQNRSVINLTSRASCPSTEWGIWHRCPCQAFVIDLEAAIGEVAA